ncbi:MAG TPA: glutathione S-transferase C-terminal domain-containing protein [Micropepsaceae bacterium]|nr:glutathione S-transferase C-terminal domain-containing protein [Micropepsaceae bacterium]
MTVRVPVIYGLTASYFTQKLLCYFRAKGIAHEFRVMNMGVFRRAGRKTGVLQMPAVEHPDGTWETDSSLIIASREDACISPAIRPADPATAFASLLLEDYGDEHLWRPALYYRWAFMDDSILRSHHITREMLSDVKLPFPLKRRFLRWRQRRHYLSGDGITRDNARSVEALYLSTLDSLEPVFKKRPFLLGERPSEADFGFFGPLYPHFACDPTPGAIMRERAPHVFLWVARMLALTPDDFGNAPPHDFPPDDLSPIFKMVANEYLPYLDLNDEAVRRRAKFVHFNAQGATFRVKPAPYRAECLARLRSRFAALDAAAKSRISGLLGPAATAILAAPSTAVDQPRVGSTPRDRLWAN